MLRIGFLTSGGDCQALNAAMRGVFKAVTRNAKERRNGSLGFAEVLLQTYNKRTKYPLRVNKLYNAKEDSDYELEEPDQDDTYEGALPENDGNPDQLSFNSFVDQDDPDEE